jgi:hypothetical protein
MGSRRTRFLFRFMIPPRGISLVGVGFLWSRPPSAWPPAPSAAQSFTGLLSHCEQGDRSSRETGRPLLPEVLLPRTGGSFYLRKTRNPYGTFRFRRAADRHTPLGYLVKAVPIGFGTMDRLIRSQADFAVDRSRKLSRRNSSPWSKVTRTQKYMLSPMSPSPPRTRTCWSRGSWWSPRSRRPASSRCPGR